MGTAALRPAVYLKQYIYKGHIRESRAPGPAPTSAVPPGPLGPAATWHMTHGPTARWPADAVAHELMGPWVSSLRLCRSMAAWPRSPVTFPAQFSAIERNFGFGPLRQHKGSLCIQLSAPPQRGSYSCLIWSVLQFCLEVLTRQHRPYSAARCQS